MGKSMEKQTSFKDEIRKSLIGHALIPCIVSILVLVVAFTAIGIRLISQKDMKASQDFSDQFTALIEEYSEKAEEISRRISVKDFRERTGYRVGEVSDIYQFLNKQDIRGDFYLFDSAYTMLFSTNRDKVVEEYLKSYLERNRNDEAAWSGMVFMYDNWNLRRKTPPSCIMLRKIVGETVTTGYGGFVIPADCFDNSVGTQDLSLVVTNRFDRVFTAGAGKFINERGKLKKEFKREQGLFTMEGRWYFVASKEALNGNVKIFAVSDCTAFIQLIIISIILVLVLSAVMIYSIYMSARTIATKKTDIMYELIAALEEVEKGNLDVKLDIRSNDEFETMGNAFNIMLGSIRHLISRHQELARENTLATVQALESQFNPHFLFNTLESIRYMIKFEPKKAEKMIVSFSRLLRYSISREEETATLEEEIGFADKYLQIMLYRYGEKLKYRIEADERVKKIEVPRMILQPIAENSIKYGFDDERTLEIIITAGIRDGELEITVTDDGKGIEKDLLEQLRENLGHRHNHSEHIGLYNVHRRICLLYGGKYGISIESILEQGTKVRLEIPADTAI